MKRGWLRYFLECFGVDCREYDNNGNLCLHEYFDEHGKLL